MEFKSGTKVTSVTEHKVNVTGMLKRFTSDFKHDLVKAINEFLKNSHDCYTKEGVIRSERDIIILTNFRGKNISDVSVLDFWGMSFNTIKKSFLYFFDEDAARRLEDGKLASVETFGGFGNGGKFSMIAAFKSSDLFTFRDGNFTAMKFSNDFSYGFYENFENTPVHHSHVLGNLGINFPELTKRFGERFTKGFTLIKGYHPVQNFTSIIKFRDSLLKNAQIRGIIRDNNVFLYDQNHDLLIQLENAPIIKMMGYEQPRNSDIYDEMMKVPDFAMLRNIFSVNLTLNVANEQLKGINSQVNNSIVFYADKVVIGEYQLKELGLVKGIMQSEFIYGECNVPFMKDLNLVRNDRKHFVAESEITKTLLHAVKEEIEKLCLNIESSTKRKNRQLQQKQLSIFSKMLDNWKNKFLENEFIEDFGGNGDTLGIDGNDSEGLNFGTNPKHKTDHKNHKKVGNTGGAEKRKANKYPRILLSGIDKDPFFNETGEEYFYCHDRATDIVQREQDVAYKYYWINCQKKYPDYIIDKYTVNSVQWKLYQFQKTIDVITLESIDMMKRSGFEKIDADFRNKLDMLRTRIIDSAYGEREILLEIEEFPLG